MNVLPPTPQGRVTTRVIGWLTTHWATTVWLPLPPLIVSLALWSRLPEAFSPDVYGRDIPGWMSVFENVLRALVFAVPVLFPIGRRRRGWVLYGVGVGAYVASYAALIVWPQSDWSTSAMGFTAPAWTPLAWLAGIGLIAGPAFFPRWLEPRHYLLLALLFAAVHTLHAARVYQRLHPPALPVFGGIEQVGTPQARLKQAGFQLTPVEGDFLTPPSVDDVRDSAHPRRSNDTAVQRRAREGA